MFRSGMERLERRSGLFYAATSLGQQPARLAFYNGCEDITIDIRQDATNPLPTPPH